MAVQVTSVISYYEVLNTLGQRQIEVLTAIKNLGVCNNIQISRYLNLPINSITPRCLELRSKGIVILHHVGSCPITGRSSRFYCIKSYIKDVMN